MSYSETIVEHLRLTVLRLLDEQPDFALNESLIFDLVEPFRFGLGRDALRVQLAWLAEQGLDGLADVYGLKVATATERGIDVARGRVVVPGVRRPGPR
jgi:hypothetical protein